MFITDNIEIKFNNPNEEFTLGLHLQTGDSYPVDEETGETDFSVEPIEAHIFHIGFLIFNITFYW